MAARRLSAWGAEVEVGLMRAADSYTGAAKHQLDIAERLGLAIKNAETDALDDDADVILDGMVGYRVRGKPKGAVADCIRWCGAHASPVLSLDLPSGMDPDTGDVGSPALKATATLTLALPKQGLAVAGAEEYTGNLYLADIGVPQKAYRLSGLDVPPLFCSSDLIRLS